MIFLLSRCLELGEVSTADGAISQITDLRVRLLASKVSRNGQSLLIDHDALNRRRRRSPQTRWYICVCVRLVKASFTNALLRSAFVSTIRRRRIADNFGYFQRYPVCRAAIAENLATATTMLNEYVA